MHAVCKPHATSLSALEQWDLIERKPRQCCTWWVTVYIYHRRYRRTALQTDSRPMLYALLVGRQTWNWVIWVIFHVRVTGSSFWPGVRPDFFRFLKKPKINNIFLWKSVQPIEILTFNKWSSKFYFPEACKRQSAIKTGKPLAHCKRLSAT